MFRLIRKIPFGLLALLGAFPGQWVDAQNAQNAQDANDALPPVLELQLLYVEANGGLANIQALKSLVSSGVITQADGQELDFKLYKKRPGKTRLSIDTEHGEMLKVFDGVSGYEFISRGGKDIQVVELDAAETEQISLGSSMDGYFFQLRSRPEWLEVVAEVEVKGVPAYEIGVAPEADLPYDKIWLGKEHFQEVKLSRRLKTNNGKEVVEEVYFSDFGQVNGVWFAKLSRYFHNGQLLQSIRIDRVRANVGIFDSYFERPKP